MKKRVLTLIGLLVIFNLNGESFKLSIEQALELAMQNNLALKMKEIDLKTKKRAKNRVWNQFIPSVSFTPGFSGNLMENEPTDVVIPNKSQALATTTTDDGTLYVNTPVNVLTPSGDLPNWAVSLGISAQLPLNAAMFTGIKVARQNYLNGLISYESAASELERDIKKSYYNLIFLKQLIALFEQNLATAQSRYDQSRVKYKNGYLPRLQMLTAQSIVESLKPQLTAQRHLYQVSLMNFKIFLGLEFEDEISLIEDKLITEKINFNLQLIVDHYLTKRLDIRLLEGNLDYLTLNKNSLLVGKLSPTAIIGINYNAMQPIYLENKPESVKWNQSASMTIGISVPLDQLIPGSKTWTQAQEMDDSIESLRIQRQNALRLAQLQIRSTILNVQKSWQNIESLEFNVELNSEVYKENETGYNVGQIDILDLEIAEDNLKQAKINLISEKVTYLGTLVDLEYSINCDIDELNEQEANVHAKENVIKKGE